MPHLERVALSHADRAERGLVISERLAPRLDQIATVAERAARPGLQCSQHAALGPGRVDVQEHRGPAQPDGALKGGIVRGAAVNAEVIRAGLRRKSLASAAPIGLALCRAAWPAAEHREGDGGREHEHCHEHRCELRR